MKPRTAGILGMSAALIITVVSGALIALPPFSILGALGVVAGLILFAVSGTWVVRNSWDPADWPSLSISAQEAMRKSRRAAIAQLAFGPLSLGLGVWMAIRGHLQGWSQILMGIVFLGIGITSLRTLKKVELDELRKQTQ